jgi:hypothetical protein
VGWKSSKGIALQVLQDQGDSMTDLRQPLSGFPSFLSDLLNRGLKLSRSIAPFLVVRRLPPKSHAFSII